MKKIWTVWMLAVLLALSASPARAAMIAGGEGGGGTSRALLASPEETLQVLRSRPSADADNLGYYFNGVYAGVVSGPQKGWVQVAIGSLTGYLREEDLIIDPPEDIAAAELPTVKVAYKDGPRLTMRAEQNYQSEKLGSYENGTDMTVLGFTEDFAHVMGPDLQVGFMMAWGVDPQLTVSTVREETKQTAPATPEGTSAPEMPAATPPPSSCEKSWNSMTLTRSIGAASAASATRQLPSTARTATPTGRPRGKTPPSPDVTIRSPACSGTRERR